MPKRACSTDRGGARGGGTAASRRPGLPGRLKHQVHPRLEERRVGRPQGLADAPHRRGPPHVHAEARRRRRRLEPGEGPLFSHLHLEAPLRWDPGEGWAVALPVTPRAKPESRGPAACPGNTSLQSYPTMKSPGRPVMAAGRGLCLGLAAARGPEARAGLMVSMTLRFAAFTLNVRSGPPARPFFCLGADFITPRRAVHGSFHLEKHRGRHSVCYFRVGGVQYHASH